jgi:hypothetical protein
MLVIFPTGSALDQDQLRYFRYLRRALPPDDPGQGHSVSQLHPVELQLMTSHLASCYLVYRFDSKLSPDTRCFRASADSQWSFHQPHAGHPRLQRSPFSVQGQLTASGGRFCRDCSLHPLGQRASVCLLNSVALVAQFYFSVFLSLLLGTFQSIGYPLKNELTCEFDAALSQTQLPLARVASFWTFPIASHPPTRPHQNEQIEVEHVEAGVPVARRVEHHGGHVQTFRMRAEAQEAPAHCVRPERA